MIFCKRELFSPISCTCITRPQHCVDESGWFPPILMNRINSFSKMHYRWADEFSEEIKLWFFWVIWTSLHWFPFRNLIFETGIETHDDRILSVHSETQRNSVTSQSHSVIRDIGWLEVALKVVHIQSWVASPWVITTSPAWWWLLYWWSLWDEERGLCLKGAWVTLRHSRVQCISELRRSYTFKN